MGIDSYSAPFHVQPGSRRDVLVLCDHASNAVPDEFERLGLDAADLTRHIGWDPGAGGVARALAAALDCPAILGGSSRLLIDLNRSPDDATLILAESDSTWVPHNLSIDDEQRADRVARFHAPYHGRIDVHLDGLIAHGVRPLVIAVHSFNPVFAGIERPWPIGVLWKLARDPVVPLLEWFTAQAYHVGDNHPYDGRVAMGYTLEQHAIRRNLRHVMFEIRNDEITTAAAQREWGLRLNRALIESRFLPQP
jgi:predicted N-formylglutamate amidohydrolase